MPGTGHGRSYTSARIFSEQRTTLVLLFKNTAATVAYWFGRFGWCPAAQVSVPMRGSVEQFFGAAGGKTWQYGGSAES